MSAQRKVSSGPQKLVLDNTKEKIVEEIANQKGLLICWSPVNVKILKEYDIQRSKLMTVPKSTTDSVNFGRKSLK